MKFVSFAALLATASAFTTSPAAFTTQSTNVGGSVNNIFADNSAHRTRKSTIVMDGKANGESTIDIKHHRHEREPRFICISLTGDVNLERNTSFNL